MLKFDFLIKLFNRKRIDGNVPVLFSGNVFLYN